MIALNLLTIVLVGYFFARPGRAVHAAFVGWRDARAQKALLAETWPVLIRQGGHLDVEKNPVVLIEFSDYQCPFCRQAHGVLGSFLAREPAIGVVYRHLPLPIHPAARGAARASICAEAQGRFLQMHNQLFTTVQWQADTNWMREAAAANVANLGEFRSCLGDPSTAARLAADESLAISLGIRGTPTFFSRSAQRLGSLSEPDLRAFLHLDR